MPPTLTGRELRRAFEAPFDDPEWSRKWVIGAGVLLLGLIIPLLPSLVFQGYLVRLIRSRLRDERSPLPGWGEWGEALIDGLRFWLVGLVYRLPAYALFALGLASLAGIPFVIRVWAERGPHTEPFWVMLPFVGWAGFAGLLPIAFLLAVAAGLVLPAAVTHAIATDRLAAAFSPAAWWPVLRSRFGSYLLLTVVMLGCSLAVGTLVQLVSATLVLCCLAPLVASSLNAYLGVVSATLYAGVYRIGLPRPSVPQAGP
jgi:hypothetical protein